MDKTTTKIKYVLVNNRDEIASLEQDTLEDIRLLIEDRYRYADAGFAEEMPYTIHEVIKTTTIQPYTNPEAL